VEKHYPNWGRKSMTKNTKAEMFNKKASDPKNKPDQVLEALALQPEQKVVDIGSGGGYFAMRFAQIVGPKGHVFAVDINLDFLNYIKECAKEKGLTNLETVLISGENPPLSEGSSDLVFMRNVCHHLPNRVEYFKKLRIVVNPDGKVAILEYRGSGGLSFHRLFGHFVAKETIIDEMKQAGYQVDKEETFLPEQSFTIFHPETIIGEK
jgi:ubiquinone/menaquinone biosynthesis C-methylase UbiE